MTILIGVICAAGALLVASPWLWPRRGADDPRPRPHPGRVSRLLEDSGFVRTPPRTLCASCLGAGAVFSALAWLLTGVWIIAVIAGVAGVAGPVVWLRSRVRRLIRARRALWPDVCDLLIASVRAGLSLPEAISSLARSAPAALAGSFAAFERDMAASGHFDASLDRLKALLADPVADRILETLRMARQVGGTELVPVLRSLSSSVRADAALRGEVESRQSWTRGAAVLGVIAPWVVLALLATRPEGAEAYSSPEGITLILAGSGVSLVAFRIMLRIGRLPEPRRWFA